MALAYKSPGVYVEEIDRGTKPIEAVGTSTAAFIGITAEASYKMIDPESGNLVPDPDQEPRLNKATLVTNWTEFTKIFGGFLAKEASFLPDAVYSYFDNGGGPCYIVSLRAVNEAQPEAKPARRSRAAAAAAATTGENPAEATPAPVVESAPLTVDEIVGDPAARTGLGALEALDDVRLVLCPDVMVGYDGSDDAKNRIKMVQEAMISHCERMKYRFAVLDTPPHLNIQQAKDWRMFINFDSSYAALYYPWLGMRDMASPGSTIKYVPPSAHVAGIMSRVDEERGVHKAPANEVVKNAVGVEISISKGEQDVLNPIGVNCIRAFPGRGLRIWGARTLSSNASWRYVNVRRLFIVVEASMDAGLQWVVFEPNDNTLWAKVRRDVTSFLRGVWRSGALFGTTPEQAFYVKCDEELNSSDVRDLGQLVIEVGMCPTKPAEFVIFRISQWAGLNAEA
jgi:phage tail sheath protein FI